MPLLVCKQIVMCYSKSDAYFYTHCKHEKGLCGYAASAKNEASWDSIIQVCIFQAFAVKQSLMPFTAKSMQRISAFMECCYFAENDVGHHICSVG